MSNLERKPVIVSVDWFRPAYLAGGPIASLENLFSLCQDDFHFHVVCSAMDLGKLPLVKITQDTWITYSKNVRVYYRSHPNNSRQFWNSLLQEFPQATVYINGIFSWHYSLQPLWYCRGLGNIILVPRGMLGANALGIKKFKKKLVLSVFRLFGFYKNICIQCTNVNESIDTQKALGCSPQQIQIIPNVPRRILPNPQKKYHPLKLCLIGRIHPVKNILGAIRIVKQLSSHAIPLDIYGPIEDSAYWNVCLQTINNVPSIRYCGELATDAIPDVLQSYSVFLLPSFGENFGHVIAEAIQAECAVLTGINTPWTWLNETGGGACLNPKNEAQFVETLKAWKNLSESDFSAFCKRGAAEFSKRFGLEDLKLKYRHLFNES